MNNHRLEYIDYAKAFAIVFIVLLHFGFSDINNFMLFVLPPFFIAAGYNFVPEKRTIKENIAMKFKTVLIPFWYCMLIYTAIEIFRAPYIGY